MLAPAATAARCFSTPQSWSIILGFNQVQSCYRNASSTTSRQRIERTWANSENVQVVVVGRYRESVTVVQMTVCIPFSVSSLLRKASNLGRKQSVERERVQACLQLLRVYGMTSMTIVCYTSVLSNG
jgi:hypothetical protein